MHSMHPCPKNKIKNHDWKLENIKRIKRNVLLKRNSRNNRIQKTEKNLPNNQIKNSVGWCNVISGIVKERISRLKDQKKSSSMKHRLTKRWNTQKSTDKDDTIKRTNISLTGI